MFKLAEVMVEGYDWRAKEAKNNFLILFIGFAAVSRLENTLLLQNYSNTFTMRKIIPSHRYRIYSNLVPEVRVHLHV